MKQRLSCITLLGLVLLMAGCNPDVQRQLLLPAAIER